MRGVVGPGGGARGGREGGRSEGGAVVTGARGRFGERKFGVGGSVVREGWWFPESVLPEEGGCSI